MVANSAGPRRSRALCPPAVLLLVSAAYFAQVTSSALDQAIADLNQQKYAEAETILEGILRIKQQNPTAEQSPPFSIGDMLFSLGSR